MAQAIEAVVFDLGGVLVDWNPEYLYSTLIPDPEQRTYFLSEVATSDWNLQMDAGQPFADAIRERSETFPQWAEALSAYFDRWEEMLGDPIEGTVDILAELDEAGWPLFALTNWSNETFGFAEAKLPFLKRFQDIVVSGREKVVKPDAAIYRLAEERYGFAPESLLFVDDREENVAAARQLGWDAVRFQGPPALRVVLAERGLL